MSEGSKEQRREEEEEEDGINLLDYLIVLAKRKKLILSITLSVAVVAFILTFSKIYFYEAQTSILPPQQENPRLANMLISEFGALPLIRGNINSKQELLVELIKSRTFTYRVINRFKLNEYYEAEDIAEARDMLLANITIRPNFSDKKQSKLFNSDKSPLIRISVKHQNPQQAADIANALVEELKIFINEIAISEASQRRLFFEEQLTQANSGLIKAEEEIRKFQERTGLFKVDTQTAITIQKIADLQAQITAKEIELQVMKFSSTTSNPDVQRIEETVKILGSELSKIEANKSYGKNSLIPTGTIPELGLEYQRKFRELKFNETLYEILVKQYEAAKIDESKDAALIQVIDRAIPPEKKIIMRRFGIKKALLLSITAFFFSCFWAFFMDFRDRKNQNKKYREKMELLKKYLFYRSGQ